MINVFGFRDGVSGNVQADMVRDLSKTKNTPVPAPAPLPANDPLANLTITKAVDNASPQAGAAVHYTLTVAALGPVSSTEVTATDVLPTGLTFVSATPSVGNFNASTGIWTIDSLEPSSTATLDLAATVDASDTVGQTITNTATVSEDATLTNDDAAQASSSATITVASPTTTTSTATTAGLTIASAVDNASPQTGAAVHYTLTVSALGPAASTNVAATDILPSGVTFVSATSSVGTYDSLTGAWTIGTLEPTSTATLDIAATVNSSDVVGASITNTATVSEDASLTNPDSANTSSSAVVTVAAVPVATSTADVSIAKAADIAAPQIGGVVHYDLTASNLGPATSTNVAATDLLPTGLTFVSATSSVGTYDSTTGVWTVGTLTPDATATLEIAATVNASSTVGETITNSATISEDAGIVDANSANNTASASVTIASSTPVTTSADLAVAKTVDNAAPQAGATVNFMVTATDLGPDSATGVAVNDLVPSGLTFVSATPSSGTYDSATGVWTVGTLSSGATSTLSIAAMVNASDTVGQTITNTATASEAATIVDSTSTNNTASASVTVASNTPVIAVAGLEVTKTIDNAAPQAGATVNYTVTASAMGPATSTGVVVNDLLPTTLTFVSATPSVGSYSSSTGAWTIGSMAANTTATLNIMAMVKSSDTVGQAITNTAMATEDSSLTNPDSAQASASATLTIAFPAPIVPQTLSIGANGNFLARGMIVTSVGASTFQAQVWGNTYTVNFSGNGSGDNDGDEFLFRNGSSPFNFDMNGGQFSDQIVVGDIVNVSGRVTTAAPFVVTANVVRNDSIMSPRSPRQFSFDSFQNGNDSSSSQGSFDSGSSGNGDGNSSSSGSSNSSSGNGGTTSTSLQTQLNGLAMQLQQLQSLFQNRSRSNRGD
jgi:uncharacterized repeat protein (TIGR01451 family)